ncbi:phage portal protein [Lacticaseibacillus rhamnosus]|uniref:phage portal protein n=1 Tax=Lacticaseibacillus rhamnosus TaxID=47715 RepID=UPI00237FB6DA|nr:phage portal protein [Lacticaseibacillus rhamnosus]MDE3295902.1 phage portal protein [Lacticaseibacillus rhamnosus]
MSIFKSIWDLVTKRQDLSFMFDSDMWEADAQRAWLKRMAIDTNVNFIAKSFSQSEFKVVHNQRADRSSELYYRLNVRPNANQSSGQFWQKFIRKLIYNNEVLVVQSDTGDLLIADGFVHNEFALYPDTFSGVTVGDYTFNRTFSMNDCLYLQYSNNRLENYVASMFGDYGKLLGRMVEVAMRSRQVRAVVHVGAMSGTNEQKAKKIQNYLDSLYKSFQDKSVAIAPETDGLEYEEKNTTAESRGTSPLEDVRNVKTQFIDDVAVILGIPPMLLHGSTAEIDQNQKAYLDYCLVPLMDMVIAEMNAKFFDSDEYMAGNHIEIVGLNKPDIVETANALDKLRAATIINGDEGRQMIGLDPTGRKEMQEYYVTKNYESVGNKSEDDTSTKGGDKDDDQGSGNTGNK